MQNSKFKIQDYDYLHNQNEQFGFIVGYNAL